MFLWLVSIFLFFTSQNIPVQEMATFPSMRTPPAKRPTYRIKENVKYAD